MSTSIFNGAHTFTSFTVIFLFVPVFLEPLTTCAETSTFVGTKLRFRGHFVSSIFVQILKVKTWFCFIVSPVVGVNHAAVTVNVIGLGNVPA